MDIDHRRPVATLEDLETLNSDEVMEGYRDGMRNERCGDNRSRSFWHGWKNGMTDFGHMERDWASAELARRYVEKSRTWH